MQTMMDEKYKTSPEFEAYQKNDIAVAFDYKDKNGDFLGYVLCDNTKK